MNIFIAYYFKDGAFNTTKNVGKICSSVEEFEKDTLWILWFCYNKIIFLCLKTFFLFPIFETLMTRETDLSPKPKIILVLSYFLKNWNYNVLKGYLLFYKMHLKWVNIKKKTAFGNHVTFVNLFVRPRKRICKNNYPS